MSANVITVPIPSLVSSRIHSTEQDAVNDQWNYMITQITLLFSLMLPLLRMPSTAIVRVGLHQFSSNLASCSYALGTYPGMEHWYKVGKDTVLAIKELRIFCVLIVSCHSNHSMVDAVEEGKVQCFDGTENMMDSAWGTEKFLQKWS